MYGINVPRFGHVKGKWKICSKWTWFIFEMHFTPAEALLCPPQECILAKFRIVSVTVWWLGFRYDYCIPMLENIRKTRFNTKWLCPDLSFKFTQFKKKVKTETAFSKGVPYFSLRKWRRIDIYLAEEYCWAMTRAAGRTFCGRSGSGALEFRFHMDWLPCIYRCSWLYVHSFPACAEPSGTLL
jgi:hypothetical protein